MQAIACLMLELQAMCDTWSGAFWFARHGYNLMGASP